MGDAKKAGKDVKPAATAAPCADPGPFSYTPPPLEAAGAHSPSGAPPPGRRARRRRSAGAAAGIAAEVNRAPGDGPLVADPISRVPRLTQASAALTHELEVLDEFGERRRIAIPAERPLTVFVDKRELVTLMTLGAAPELLVLGYLRNQRLVQGIDDVESITVDWEVASAAVKTRSGIVDLEAKTAKRVVTTGCGQGTVFGDLMDEIDSIVLPDAADASARLSQARAVSPAQRHAPAGEHLQVGRLGARLRALSAGRDAAPSSRTSGATTRSTPSPAGCGCTACTGATRSSTPPAG